MYISKMATYQWLRLALVTTILPATVLVASICGCTVPSDSAGVDQLSKSTSTTCKGNKDGLYCANNPNLNLDPNAEFYPTYLIHCVGGKEDPSGNQGCEDVCIIKPAGTNDTCGTSTSTTCQGNKDGWYCANNPSLNVDPSDKFSNKDLVHCVGSQKTGLMGCSYGCTVKTAGMNDVCSAQSVATTCQGNADGWYCSTNPELTIGPNDEFFDGDLIHCVGQKSAGSKGCQPSDCIIKPVGVDDVCAGAVCGNGVVESPEKCDKSNLNGHTCTTEGFDNGSVSCTGSCTVNAAGCCKHSCVGNIQCVGTAQQTCKDSNGDGCNEWITTGTCATNPVCGNSVIEGAEQCDQSNMNGHTCTTDGFNGGSASCTGSCTVSTASCCKHTCTGTTQCTGTSQQTCKDSNGDGCSEWVTTGTCPTNPVCGNSVIEGSEQCDQSNMNGHTCVTDGFNGGSASCTGSCTVSTSSCCKHACTTGTTQCTGTSQQTCKDSNNDGCSEWVTTGTCPTNPVCGNSVIEGTEQCDQSNMNGHTCITDGFNGGSASCTGSCTVSTSACCKHTCTGTTQCSGTTLQTCKDGNNDGCNEWVATGSCGTPTCTTVIESGLCPDNWTVTSGTYDILQVCAQVVNGDQIRLRTKKTPAAPFSTRPYGVKVFGTTDPECSHTTTTYQSVLNVNTAGVLTNELTHDFTVAWATGQTAKRYCVFASTVPSDQGYNANDPQQKIWWYSQHIQVKRVCN